MEEEEQAMLMTSKTIRGGRIFNRPRNDVFVESDTAQTIGATVNMSPINNRDVVICVSNQQANRPFVVNDSYGFDPLASGDTAIDLEVSKALTCANGRNGASALAVKKNRTRTAPVVLNFQGSKGNNVVSQDGTCPTLNSMHGHDVHVVCVPINSMIIGKDGGNGDRQTFGIGEDGDPSPTLQTAHHHAVAITKTRKKAFGIDQQGGKGGASYTEDVAPTILSDSHGTPHGVCLVEGT